MSLKKSSPPGLSTRKTSLKSCSLKGERLTTQLEMTTSTLSLGMAAMSSMKLSTNSTLLASYPKRSICAAS